MTNLTQSPTSLILVFEDNRAIIHEERAMIEAGVVLPTYQAGELFQFVGEAGKKYRGIVGSVSHAMTIGSGQVGLSIVIRLHESREET